MALILIPATAQAQAPARNRLQERDRVDQYLDRLGATGLQVWMLERERERNPDANDADAIAARLAELYGRQLIAAVELGDVTELNGKLDRLVAAHPRVDTPSLRMLRLEGEFARAEALILRWIDEPEDRGARDAALAIIDRIGPELERRRNEMLAEVARGNGELDRLDRSRRNGLERRVRELSELAGRATYYAGWSSYYENLIRPMGDGGDRGFREARLSFRKLLDLVDDRAPLDPGHAPFDTPSQARVLLGLALAEVACGDLAAGRSAFRVLRDPKTHDSVRDWADYWEVWALLRARQPGPARAVAEAAVAAFPARATPPRAALCKILIRGGDEPAARSPALRVVGVRGLVRLRRFDLARGLLRRDPIDPAEATGILRSWIAGQALLEKGEESRERADYEAAAAAFREAIDGPEAPAQPELVAVCRYALGCCAYRLDDFAEAIPLLRRAAEDLTRLGLGDADDAEWTVALAELRAADDADARDRAAALFRDFRERHPDHPNATLVDRILEQVGTNPQRPRPVAEPTPTSKTAERCRDIHRRWRRLDAPARRGSALATDLQREVDGYLQSAGPDAAGDDLLDVLLIALELDLLRTEIDPDEWRSRSDRAIALACDRPTTDRRVIRLFALRLRLAERLDDPDMLDESARWLVANCAGTPQEVEAFVALARRADRALAERPDDPGRRRAAREGYQRLADRLGDSPDVLRKNTQARAARSRLADLAREDGRPGEAAGHLDALRAAFPRDADLLLRAGRAHRLAGDTGRSLECWSLVLSGSPAGSEAWWEAKVGQLECLAERDPARARRAFDQFRLLHPEPWPARVRGPLAAVADRLK